MTPDEAHQRLFDTASECGTTNDKVLDLLWEVVDELWTSPQGMTRTPGRKP